MNAINQTYTGLITTGTTMINGVEQVTLDACEELVPAGNEGSGKPFARLLDVLASYLATSNFGRMAIRGITIIDLVLLSVDLWGW